MAKTTVFDVVESAHAYSHVPGMIPGTFIDAGYTAVELETNKVLVHARVPVRVHVIDVGYGVIRQVRFDSNNRAIYDIVLDQAVGPENDQSRDWVARREELEEVPV